MDKSDMLPQSLHWDGESLPDTGWRAGRAADETSGFLRPGGWTSKALRIIALPQADGGLSALKSGLLRPDARIEPKYFYDSVGCALFADICRLPEYYLTRTEATIFATYRQQIAARIPVGAQWVDLGCGDGVKSRQWLNAVAARRFVGVDSARGCLAGAVAAMAQRFPQLECLGVVADLTQPLSLHAILAERPEWPTVFFYPGSSLGNFSPAAAGNLLRAIREHLDGDGGLLIGVDLMKERFLLEAAYNDALGVTAAFNRNILRVVNRLIDADFDPDAFEHRAIFVADHGRIEMRLHARVAHGVRIGGDRRHFAADESILTEYSHKYTVDGFSAVLADAGFRRRRVWRDAHGWFGVFLAQP